MKNEKKLIVCKPFPIELKFLLMFPFNEASLPCWRAHWKGTARRRMKWFFSAHPKRGKTAQCDGSVGKLRFNLMKKKNILNCLRFVVCALRLLGSHYTDDVESKVRSSINTRSRTSVGLSADTERRDRMQRVQRRWGNTEKMWRKRG